MTDTPRSHTTAALEAAFIAAYRVTGNVAAAAKHVGVHRGTPHKWRERDPEFATAWEDAKEALTDELEQEARRRALEGVEDYVVSNGRLVYIDDPDTGERKPLVRRVYSDRLMELLLRGHRPDVFRERISQEITGKDGGPLALAAVREDLVGRLRRLSAGAPTPELPGESEPEGS